MLASLRRAAKGLGCELVYALVPKEGTLKDHLAAEQRATHEKALATKREKREAQKKPWLEEIGWREKFLGSMRTLLRREGFRVRPRKTERGVEKEQAAFREAKELAGVAGMMGRAMSESASQRVGEQISHGRSRSCALSGKGA